MSYPVVKAAIYCECHKTFEASVTLATLDEAPIAGTTYQFVAPAVCPNCHAFANGMFMEWVSEPDEDGETVVVCCAADLEGVQS